MITREQIKLAGIASQTDKVTHHAYERFFPRFVSGLDGTGSIVEIGYGDGASTPSARKDDASPFEPAGGLMEQINASIQRGCSI